MKKYLIVLCFYLISVARVAAQGTQTIQLSPGGVFDKVYDRFGNVYALSDLLIEDGTRVNYAIPTQSCIAGYFHLYFAPGSIFSNSLAARTTMCQLFTDLSGLIKSPLAGNSKYVNIYCEDTPNGSSSLGTASSWVSFPYPSANANQGILDSPIQKYIISGTDPYSTIPVSIPNPQGLYHGTIRANPGITWNFNLATSTITATEFDFYSVMLHEALHLLGIESYISASGISIYGSNNNYFTRYDKFLTDASGSPLLSNGTFSCPTSNLTFVPSPTVIATLGSSTTGCIGDVTTCSLAARYAGNLFNIPLYTPNCFDQGSSLCHFEDQCPFSAPYGCATNTASSNNLYYVMSNGNAAGSCYVKRFPKEEERSVLCDLGYSVNATYTSVAAASNYTYMYGACNGPGLYGLDDGLSNGAFTFTVLSSATNTMNIPVSTVLLNDAPSATISCLEVVNGTATTAIVGSNISVTATPNFSGLIILKYIPKNASNQYGNITYVFCYFISADCNPPSTCDMIQNGGFENIASGFGPCGQFGFQAKPSCFTEDTGTPDLVAYGCPPPNNIGPNTAIDTYNGPPNNSITQCIVFTGNSTESFRTVLTSNLVPGNSYQLSLLANNVGNLPVVIAVASNSVPVYVGSIPFPTNLNLITTFTVPPSTGNKAWSLFTHTFVFTSPGSLSHPVIAIGPDPVASNLSTFQFVYFDELSMTPLGGPSFVINPNTGNCSAKSFSNLAQFASSHTGNFTGTGVANVNGVYSFNYPAFLPPGYYPISFNYTTSSGCTGSIPQIIHIPGITTGSCTTTQTIATAGFSYGTTYSWSPGLGSQNFIIVTPTAPSVYTLTATEGSCVANYTISAAPCCSQPSVTSFTSKFISSNVSSATAFNNDVIVLPNTNITLSGSEFVFGPNTKLTVSSGAVLTISGAHLYACSGDMWDGIEVLDGGKIITSSGSLIEDAKTAILVQNHVTTPGPLIMEINGTTFNKNYIDISVSGYSQQNSSIFDIKQSVFTCRDLPFTTTAWPSTNASSSVSTTGAELRHAFASTPTTGLTPPYLNQSTFTITNLKKPYASQRSHIAIKLNNVGVVNTTTRLGAIVGSTTNVGDYNVFDAHGQFISAINSNVTSLNNVFQNTETYTTTAGNFGGEAIFHSTSNTTNTELLLNAANKDLGSRFWNCHKGVKATNLYRLDAQNATLRSTQTSTSNAFVAKGIEILTNRFEYYINENEFTNIHTGINIATGSGPFMTTGTAFSTGTKGIFADRLRITENLFTGSVATFTNSYMEWATYITGPFSNFWNVIPNGSVTPAVHALAVTINTVTDATNGFMINGVRTLPTITSDNVVTLKQGSSIPQYGIALVNSNSTNTGNAFLSQQGENAITNNTVTFSGVISNTNIPGALVYCDQIGFAALSPSITCNDIGNGVQGFLFSGSSPGTIWAGNNMSSLERGLVLNNAGVIGVQGGSMTAVSNLWDGAWGSKSHTYVDVSSDAINSVLYCKSAPGFTPTSNAGPAAPQNYQLGQNYFTTSVGAGDYNCYNMPNYKTISLPNNDNEFLSPELFYIQQMAFYNLVHMNDSVRNSDGDFEEFHDTYGESSIGKFVAADEFLYAEDYNEAYVSLSEVSDDLNTVEFNYLQFYTLYATYLEKGSLSEQEAEDLYDLALLCPGTNGSSVFQARALYNTLYHEIISTACDEDFGDRKAVINGGKGISNSRWNLKLFPNPTEKVLNIRSGVENELLKIKIFDLSGRMVFEQDVKVNGFLTKLDLNLVNGAYFVHVQNQENKFLVQKLLIAK